MRVQAVQCSTSPVVDGLYPTPLLLLLLQFDHAVILKMSACTASHRDQDEDFCCQHAMLVGKTQQE